MIGVELSPAAASVRPGQLAMFHATAKGALHLVGLLVGVRSDPERPWEPGVGSVTIEAVVVHGVHLSVGELPQMVSKGDKGWPLSARVRPGQTLVVYVRNNAAVLRELRVVLAFNNRRASG